LTGAFPPVLILTVTGDFNSITMANGSEIKKIERRAKSMLLDKDIPPAKMEIVRSLIKNDKIPPEERYRAIIELVQSCPDKVVQKPANRRRAPSGGATAGKKKHAPAQPESPMSAPTETSYFINEIHEKYRHLKLFKKRYLIHKNNRIGLGIKKRLIPSKNLLKLFGELSDFQGIVISRINTLLNDILNDETIENPLVFNYLRKIRRWLLEEPLIKYPYESLKWMDAQNFERELRASVANYFSFLRLDAETRESIILMVENKLRATDELKKEDVFQADTDQARSAKEKRNLEKEKKIYEFIMTFRSFLPTLPEEENLVSKWLKNRYGINHYTYFLHIVLEALVYQRPFTEIELHEYFAIKPPVVSPDKWDYSEDILKKVGKDPESRRRKQADVIREELEPYEVKYLLLNLDDNGRDLLMRSADEQLKLVDKKKYDVDALYRENFFSFLDALVNYFNNAYVPLLNGSTVEFTDLGKDSVGGALFSPDYFSEEMSSLNSILNEMHFFRSNNPTLALSHDEIKKIMKGQIQTMNHVHSFITMIGDFFYRLARVLQPHYENHGNWIARGKNLQTRSIIRTPLKPAVEVLITEEGYPLPFFDCSIKGFEDNRPLSARLEGKRVITDSMRDGVFVHIIAFAYQLCYECMNERFSRDMAERKKLLGALKDIEKSAQRTS